jgi:ribonucleoside-diphosphate reductase alpha chain
VAVNQGGKRKGAVCTYLETWHLDIEEFLELRKNTGDDRRRTHDMNTANWIPDLFMRRVMEKANGHCFHRQPPLTFTINLVLSLRNAYTNYETRPSKG